MLFFLLFGVGPTIFDCFSGGDIESYADIRDPVMGAFEVIRSTSLGHRSKKTDTN
jgi:hypothetical protein